VQCVWMGVCRFVSACKGWSGLICSFIHSFTLSLHPSFTHRVNQLNEAESEMGDSAMNVVERLKQFLSLFALPSYRILATGMLM